MSDAAKFQNALRIGFHRDPMRAGIRMDAETWAKVYALIEARQ